MPHFTLEYSANLEDLDPAACLRAVHRALVASGQFEEVDIKSRAVRVQHFLVGTSEAGRGFVAGQVAILSGRTLDVKKDLSARTLAALRAALPPSPGLQVQVSVEVVDIERASYAKAVIEAAQG